MEPQRRCTAFTGARRIASGALAQVALKAKAIHRPGRGCADLLIFDDATAELIEWTSAASLRTC